MPYSEISNNDHQFLGALSQKKKMTFREITNQDLKILLFQALRSLDFENKGNFWINCVRVKTFTFAYPQGDICIKEWKFGLASCFDKMFAFTEKDWHQGQQYKVYQWHIEAYWLYITLVRSIMAFINMARGMTFAFRIYWDEERWKRNKTNSDEKRI